MNWVLGARDWRLEIRNWKLGTRAMGLFSQDYCPMTTYLPGPVSKEALIDSLSNFILGFLFNARKEPTRIASLFKEASDEAVNKNPYEIRFCELISASGDVPFQLETPKKHGQPDYGKAA